jgi:hypothetical protein
MRAAVLGAGMALVLISQPATSQTLGTGHKSGVLSGGIGLTRHTGGAGPSRFTALGGHAGFGVTPGAVSISTGMARPAAVTVSSGLTPVRGFAAPSLHAVVPTIPPGGGAALDVRTAVPTAPVRGGVGTTSSVASIGTGVARSTAVAAPSGAMALGGGAAPALRAAAPVPAPAAPVSTAAVGTGGGVGPSATGLGSTAGNTVPAGATTSTIGSSIAGTSFASTSVLPLPAALRPAHRTVDGTANLNQIAALTLRQMANIDELERRRRSIRLTSDERGELDRLRRENQQLRLWLARAR